MLKNTRPVGRCKAAPRRGCISELSLVPLRRGAFVVSAPVRLRLGGGVGMT
jgi:hypothetical protein